MKRIGTSVMKDGQDKLKANLNEDIYEAKFIKDQFWQSFYLKISQGSAYLFNFVLLQLATTTNLKEFDPIAYYVNSQQKTLLITIVVLTFICSHGEGQAQKSDDGLDEHFELSSEWKMITELVCDTIRIVDYYLVYHYLNLEVFDKTENNNLQITGFALFAMYVLFILRKFIFWLNILLVQKIDLQRWKVLEKIKDTVGEIGEDEKFRKMKAVIDNLQSIHFALEDIRNSHPVDASNKIEEYSSGEEMTQKQVGK